jgi:competence protein ComGC
MGIQERDYYKEKTDRLEKEHEFDLKKILIWILIISMILGLIIGLIPK